MPTMLAGVAGLVKAKVPGATLAWISPLTKPVTLPLKPGLPSPSVRVVGLAVYSSGDRVMVALAGWPVARV